MPILVIGRYRRQCSSWWKIPIKQPVNIDGMGFCLRYSWLTRGFSQHAMTFSHNSLTTASGSSCPKGQFHGFKPVMTCGWLQRWWSRNVTDSDELGRSHVAVLAGNHLWNVPRTWVKVLGGQFFFMIFLKGKPFKQVIQVVTFENTPIFGRSLNLTFQRVTWTHHLFYHPKKFTFTRRIARFRLAQKKGRLFDVVSCAGFLFDWTLDF